MGIAGRRIGPPLPMRYDDDDDGGPRNGGAEIAGLDSDGVDFTEMS